jgi:hypothetical protein
MCKHSSTTPKAINTYVIYMSGGCERRSATKCYRGIPAVEAAASRSCQGHPAPQNGRGDGGGQVWRVGAGHERRRFWDSSQPDRWQLVRPLETHSCAARWASHGGGGGVTLSGRGLLGRPLSRAVACRLPGS